MLNERVMTFHVRRYVAMRANFFVLFDLNNVIAAHARCEYSALSCGKDELPEYFWIEEFKNE